MKRHEEISLLLPCDLGASVEADIIVAAPRQVGPHVLVLVDLAHQLLRYAQGDVLLPGALLPDCAWIMTAVSRINRDNEYSRAFFAGSALAPGIASGGRGAALPGSICLSELHALLLGLLSRKLSLFPRCLGLSFGLLGLLPALPRGGLLLGLGLFPGLGSGKPLLHGELGFLGSQDPDAAFSGAPVFVFLALPGGFQAVRLGGCVLGLFPCGLCLGLGLSCLSPGLPCPVLRLDGSLLPLLPLGKDLLFHLLGLAAGQHADLVRIAVGVLRCAPDLIIDEIGHNPEARAAVGAEREYLR